MQETEYTRSNGIKMKMQTTKISTILDSFELEMTGEESFPIEGEWLNPVSLKILMKNCKGLHPHFDCLAKAMHVLKMKEYGKIILGSLLVWNKEKTANFGYYRY